MDDVSDWSAIRTRPKPLTIPEILDGMFDLWVTNWRAYVLAVGSVVIPISFVTAYLTASVFGGQGLFAQFTETVDPIDIFRGDTGRSFIGLVALSVFTAVLITPFTTAVSCRIAADGYRHHRPTPGSVLVQCLRRYPAIIGVSLLLLLLVALLFAPGLGLVIVGVTGSQPASVAVGVLLLFAAVIPVVWLMILFNLAYVCIVVEGVGPVSALRRSRTLVQGQWWRMLFAVMLAGITATIVAQILAIPLQIPGDAWGEWVAVALATIAGVIVAMLSTSLTANADTLLYFDARVRREGYDVELMIDEVATPLEGQRLG